MASERQLIANRRNAQRSTGPRTAEGKARVAQNAVSHGMFAKHAVLEGEDVNELVALRQGLYASLRPRDEMEVILVERIATATWKLRRVAAAEADWFAIEGVKRSGRIDPDERKALGLPDQYYLNPKGKLKESPKPVLSGHTVLAMLADRRTDVAQRFALQEQRLENAIHRALRQLREYRKQRDADGEADDALWDEAPLELPQAPAGESAVTAGEAESQSSSAEEASTSDAAMTEAQNERTEPISNVSSGSQEVCELEPRPALERITSVNTSDVKPQSQVEPVDRTNLPLPEAGPLQSGFASRDPQNQFIEFSPTNSRSSDNVVSFDEGNSAGDR